MSTLAWIALLVWGGLTWRGLRSGPPLAPRPEAAPSVAVVCPARNEAEIIEAALDGLLAQRVGTCILVDDRSEDGTREKALARTGAGLVVLEAPEPEPGVFGKPAALAHAVGTADPVWWLFVDADVELQPGAAAAMVAEAERRQLGLLSAHPAQRLETWWEQIVMPAVFSLVWLAFPPERVGRRGPPFANGQILLVKAEAYRQAGGHAALRDRVLEDVALAERVAGLGHRIGLVDGRHLGRTRMYASWSELREGWEKNLWLILGGQAGPSSARVGLALLLAWSGPLVALVEGGPGVLVWTAIVAMQARLRAHGGMDWRFAPLAPLGALAAAGLVLGSWRRHRSGRITWKGRSYPG